jgi:hypothetical protein
MRRPSRIHNRIAAIVAGATLVAAAMAAQAQGTATPALPPVPTPTALYPGAGSSSPYSSPSGQTLYSWQSLYLPIYWHLYHGGPNAKSGKPAETLLSTHVSIRNIDPRASLQVTSARYYDTEGKLLREFIQKPQGIAPLGNYEIYIPRSDFAAGSGANLIISCTAERPINPPLFEALHADIRDGGRTLFFITTARAIETR